MYPRTLTEILAWRAASTPEAEFGRWILGPDETLVTYGALHTESVRIAAGLRARGIDRGDTVLIMLPSGPDLWSTFLGTMLLGAVPSFMPGPSAKQDPARFWTAHAQLFERIGPGALLSHDTLCAAIRHHLPSIPQLVLDLAELAPHPSAVPFTSPIQPDDIALLQHSSGTTGLKKGVALSHRAILNQLRSYGAQLELTETDRIISWLPLYHDMGLIACFLLPLVHGVPVAMLDPFEWVAAPRRFFAEITRLRPTLCWQPNFAFQHHVRSVRPTPETDLSSMRAWINCSEPCRAESFELFATRFQSVGVDPAALKVCYAMAETVFAVAQTDVHHRAKELVVATAPLRSDQRITVASSASPDTRTFLSAGRVLDGLEVTITDQQGQALPPDRVGVITLRGTCLFTGYHRLDEVTARKLRDGRYLTGDLGFLHDGELYVLGREDNLIIVHGRNYTAHELEFLINQVPGVHPGRNVAVGWYRAEVGSQEVVIIVEFDQVLAGARSPEDLATDIRQAILDGAGLLPFDVMVVPPGWLLKTTSGKIARGANLTKYQSARAHPPSSLKAA